MRAGGSGAIAILTYHSLDTSGSVVSVAPDTFADQIACLADLGFRGIALREAVAQRSLSGSWPPQCVVLTFDDGYANFYDVGWRILQRFGFTATVFLVTQHVGGSNDWVLPPARLGRRAMLSWQQVAELSASGVEVAAHTQTHPSLRQLSPEAAATEIVASRSDIESRLQQPVESFAYPFGHVTAAAAAIVQREFRAACTTVLRRARQDAPACLPRVDAYYLQTPDTLTRLLKGQLDRYLMLRRWGRWARAAVT